MGVHPTSISIVDCVRIIYPDRAIRFTAAISTDNKSRFELTAYNLEASIHLQGDTLEELHEQLHRFRERENSSQS